MVDRIFDTLTSQTKNFIEPVEKFNNILLKNMEKVAELQVETIRSLAEIGSLQVKEMTEIRDVEGLKNFSTGNVSRMVEFNKKVMEDVKSMGEIGINFKHDVEQLMADFKGAFQAADVTEEEPSPAKEEAAKTDTTTTTTVDAKPVK